MESHSGTAALAALVRVILVVVAGLQDARGESCGGNLLGSGLITSPNYPDQYPDFTTCQWDLTADDTTGGGNSISLFIEDLNLEHHYDTLEVYSEGILITRYKGPTVPHKSVYGRRVTIIFTSDISIADSGFSIFFNSTGPECGVSCSSAGCTVWTPNFPYPYPKGSRCEWNFGNGIDLIAFASTTVSAMPFTGELRIASTSNGSPATVTYHSPAPVPTAAIFERTVTLKFSSQGCMTGNGFLVSLTRKTTRCGGQLVGHGLFTTPNYPANYVSSAVCVWRLTALPGLRVQLMVTLLSTEEFNDYVRVYSDNRLFNSYSGNYGPFNLTLGGDVSVEFQSDDIIQSSGLLASFISVP